MIQPGQTERMPLRASKQITASLSAMVRAYSTDTLASQSHSSLELENPKPYKDIPGSAGLPILGTLLQYRTGPFRANTYHHALLQKHLRYGDIFKETICGHTIVHLFDPEYIKVMYSVEGKTPHIPPLLETTQLYRKTREMSLGLGNTNGEEWYRLRSAVQQMMMRPKAVSMFLPQVNEVLDDFLARIHRIRDPSTGFVSGFKNEILKWTLESSAMTCFEKRLGSFDCEQDSLQQRMINASQDIFRLSLKLRFSIPLFKFFPTPTWKQLMAKEDLFFGNGQKMVDDTVSHIKSLIDKGELIEGQFGFLTYLINQGLSYKDLSIISLSLFADGLSTTSPTTVGQLYCLATNPEKQQKLREQIMEVAPNPETPVTPEIINSLSYLKACVKEGFRFFPIGTEVSRIPQSDIVIGGYQIPAGTHVQLNNNMLLRMAKYFDDPEVYIPERWMRDGSGQNVHPYLLLPFGFGPRTCAGKRFAEQEMYALIIKILQRYRIEWPHKERMRQKYNMLLTPDVDKPFRFVPL